MARRCTGDVARVTGSPQNSISKLRCCRGAQPQEQALVRQWKQTRPGLFSTVPLPFGSSSFSTGGYDIGIAGPPTPGKATSPSLGHGGPILPPSHEVPPPSNQPRPDIPD